LGRLDTFTIEELTALKVQLKAGPRNGLTGWERSFPRLGEQELVTHVKKRCN